MSNFIVGDIHGCYDLLMKKLEEVSFDFKKDTLYSVGDIIDRGPDSLKCLRLVKEPWFEMVVGNHEQMAIDAAIYKAPFAKDLWLANGGSWYYLLEEEAQKESWELLKYIRENKDYWLTLEAPKGKINIAHASWDSDETKAIWDRTHYYDIILSDEKPYPSDEAYYFGHTPVEKVEIYNTEYYIDTGAFLTGNLTILEL